MLRLTNDSARARAAFESARVGLGSRSYDRGRYAPRVETGEHHFHRLLHRYYAEALAPSG